MQKFSVTSDDHGTFEVEARARDIVQWEKTTKGVSAAQLERDTRMVDLYKVCWIAAKRTGQFTGSLAEFEASCDVEGIAEEEPDPTQSGASSAA